MLLRQGSIVKKSPGPFEQSHHVTLSEAKGLSRSAAGCFPFAEFTLERSEGLRASAHALSMTGLDLSVDEELLRTFEPCLTEIVS